MAKVSLAQRVPSWWLVGACERIPTLRASVASAAIRHRSDSRKRRVTAGLVITLLIVTMTHVLAFAAVSGNDWKRLPEPARDAFIMGVLDGIQHVRFLFQVAREEGAKRGITEPRAITEAMIDDAVGCWFERKVPYSQLIALVNKYLTDHPDTWHFGMAFLTTQALAERCKK